MENKIKEFRERAKLSPESLAAKIGLSKDAVYAWECGRCDPTLFNAFCLAEVLGVRLEDLFQIEQPTGPIPHREMTRLEQMRRAAGVSIRELSEFCAISQTTINNYENSTYAPSLCNALSLARAFGMTVEELFDP